MQAVPLNQQIERGDGERQAGQDVVHHAMTDLLEMTDQGQHRKHGLDQHAVVPGPARAEFEVGRIALGSVEAGIGQDDHAVLEPLNQGMKPGIVGVGRRAEPTDDFTPLIDQQTQLTADDPPMIGESLTTDLGRAAPFANRMDQFDAIAVDHAQQGGWRQEQQGPLPMGLELTKQPGPLRQVGEQGWVVPRQPAVERAITYPLQGMQNAQRHYFAGPQRRLGMLGQGPHPIIDPAKQVRDKVDGGHDRSPVTVNLECIHKLTWGRSWPLQLSLKN